MKTPKLCALFVLVMVFSAYQASAQVSGSGTAGTVPVWVSTTKLGNSVIVQANGNVGIGLKKPPDKFDVVSASKTAAAISGNSNATSGTGSGVIGISASPTGFGLFGISNAIGGTAINAEETATTGFNIAISGHTHSTSGPGVFGLNDSTIGGTGVQADIESTDGTGVAGLFVAHNGAGLILSGLSGTTYTKVFSVDAQGNGFFAGSLSKGSGSFKIDHPLDPANKYLSHSFVESPDMMNIYNGIVVLDSNGEAIVEMPDYFQALNTDFRYQLTAIGAPGPNLYIAQEISGNRFKIAGGKTGSKVSWQVTGIRQDAYAKAHRIQVEEEKASDERGHYLHPELFGATEEKAIGNQPATTLPGTTTVANATRTGQ